MDICMFSPFSFNAPSSYRLLSFASVLTKKGHNVTVVLPSYDRYSSFKIESSSNNNGVKLSSPFQLKTRKLAVNMFPYMVSATLNSLSRRYDILHVLKPTPMTCSGYAGKFLFGTPAIQDIDDLDHVIMAAEHHSVASTWIMEQCERILPKFANQIIVSCSPLKTLYSSMGLESKITKIPNGVFVDDFVADVDIGIKEKYHLKDKVVIYVGSLNNEAQISPLIFAMQKILSTRKDVSCLIVGDGNAREYLQRLVNNLTLESFIVFTGRIPHSLVPNFISVADVGFACFPKLDYFKYASNIKVFEYMAAGVPPVVSPDGDLPLYVDNGNAGIIASSKANELSIAILDLLSDERKRRRLADNAKRYVKRFDWALLTEDLLSVYNGAL